MLMTWASDPRFRRYKYIEPDASSSCSVNLRTELPSSYYQVRFLQTYESSTFVGTQDHEVEVEPHQEQVERNALSPITEESTQPTEDDSDYLLSHQDAELQVLLTQVQQAVDLSEPVESSSDNDVDSLHYHMHTELIKLEYRDNFADGQEIHTNYVAEDQETCANYHLVAANVRAGLPRDTPFVNPGYSEVYFEGPAWKLLAGQRRSDNSRNNREYVTVLRIQHKENVRRSVVVRKDDNLSFEEQLQYKHEVNAAKLDELRTWAKYGCFSARPRATSKNVIDSRWVLKWKHELASIDATESKSAQQVGRWVIRARLTVRGFKDAEKHLVDRYAGTSQRYSQRCLVSEAVRRGWSIATTDISKAFLQGVTYQELSELTGEPLWDVSFTLPQTDGPLLRSVEGFENFDFRSHVLHCDKPGTGSVDAPRCFSMKLNLCTSKDCFMQSSSVDGEMCMLHVDEHQRPPSSPQDRVSLIEVKKPVLVALLTKHVDDLKITGETSWVMWIITRLQDKFGKLKIIWDNFTNCGVCHGLLEDGSRTLDQIQYANNLRLISHADLKHKPSDSECSKEVHELYRSLLGAVAFMYLTRADVLVFITACQRHGHAPKVIHVKRLNTIVRWIQSNSS